MYHLLVVDDEKQIRTLIRKYAEFMGYAVTEAENGMEAVSMAKTGVYDLIIMDIMMPEVDGFFACREIRRFSSVPVIMLSARGEEYDKINGFECGADDYVVKPFSPRELMLRVDVVLKRAGRKAPANVYTVDGLVVDMAARIVTVDGVQQDLSPREYELLFFMVKNRGKALTRDTLLREVWGSDFEGDERTLDTHVKLLRKLLGAYAGHIVTLRGVGYRFDA